MKKRKNQSVSKQTELQNAAREKYNQTIENAATSPVKKILMSVHSSLRGLDEKEIIANRASFGNNKVTHEKKKTLPQRLAAAFINPFTAILFCLAIVSMITDMILPYFALFGSDPEDFDPLTVVIILTMVLISGTLRYVQETRSGNAAEKLLAMITTTCTVTRREKVKAEDP